MYLSESHLPVQAQKDDLHRLVGRQAPNGSSQGSSPLVSIVASIVIVASAIIIILSYLILRRMRSRGSEPRLIPTSFLKRKWQAWTPRSHYAQINAHDRSRNLSATNTAYVGGEIEERAATNAAAAGVDRNTSIRSVMTLPAYSQTPKETEQVLGREGEREGMDTVVEFPETLDEEETRREEQMNSLYQIRLARRQEVAEREANRRERREARERGDWARLEQLRRESRARAVASNTASESSLNGIQSASAATLIAEHQSRERERRVSSVAYGALGQVRHDGSRVRANSNGSERGGLLDGAAEMGEGQGRGRGLSDATSFYSNLTPPHSRHRSNSSALSISSAGSDLDLPAAATPGSTLPDETRPPRSSHSNATSNSSPTINRYTPEESTGSDDIGESRMLPTSPVTGPNPRQSLPPDYEQLDWGDAPAYTEAEVQARRASQRASASRYQAPLQHQSLASGSSPPQPLQLNLPSIYIEGATEPNTPVTPNMR